MTVLERLASSLGRRDEAPNQQLAAALAKSRDVAAIRELVANLHNPDPKVQSDCIKVLYEIGYRAPDLIAAYVQDFLQLLGSRKNRMVWGGMCALATIAEIKADVLFEHRQEIQAAIDAGSVITQDRGIKALAAVAGQKTAYRAELLPYLLNHLASCRSKDVPQRAEAILKAIDGKSKRQFIEVVRQRMPETRPSQAKRLEKVIAAVESL